MKRTVPLRVWSAIVASIGLATASAFAADSPSSADASAYPSYYDYLVSSAVLLQDDDQENQGDESPARPDTVEIAPKAFTALAEDVLRGSETGLMRPGEIETVPRYAYKLGDVRLFPRYHQEVRFDDNIFLTDTVSERREAGISNPEKDARKWDVRFEERPGLFIEYPFGGGNHNFRAGYEANFVNFMHRHQGFGFIEQFAGAATNFSWNNAYLSAGDRYELRYDPIETQFAGASGGAGQPINQLKRGLNTATYKVGVKFDQINLEHSLTHYDVNFAGPGTITRADRDELTPSFLFGYYTSNDLRVFFQYDYSTRRQREHYIGDTFFNRYSLGMDGKLSEDIDTNSRIGWRHQLSETGNPIADSTSRDGGIDVSSENRWRLNDSTFLTLAYLRESQFSIQANLQIVDRGEIGLRYLLYKNVMMKTGYFVERVNPSKPGTSPFTSGGVGIGLKYVIEDWIDFDMDYTHRYRISDEPGADYYNNLLSASVNLKF